MKEFVSNHPIEPRRALGLTAERAALEPHLGEAVLRHVLEIIFVDNPTAKLQFDDTFECYPLSGSLGYPATSTFRPHSTSSCELI